jgi:hypothetical protein
MSRMTKSSQAAPWRQKLRQRASVPRGHAQPSRAVANALQWFHRFDKLVGWSLHMLAFVQAAAGATLAGLQ